MASALANQGDDGEHIIQILTDVSEETIVDVCGTSSFWLFLILSIASRPCPEEVVCIFLSVKMEWTG